jgi:hypothetical protein
MMKTQGPLSRDPARTKHPQILMLYANLFILKTQGPLTRDLARTRDHARTKQGSSPYSPQRGGYLSYEKLIADLKTHSPFFYVLFPTTHFFHTI